MGPQVVTVGKELMQQEQVPREPVPPAHAICLFQGPAWVQSCIRYFLIGVMGCTSQFVDM